MSDSRNWRNRDSSQSTQTNNSSNFGRRRTGGNQFGRYDRTNEEPPKQSQTSRGTFGRNQKPDETPEKKRNRTGLRAVQSPEKQQNSNRSRSDRRNNNGQTNRNNRRSDRKREPKPTTNLRFRPPTATPPLAEDFPSLGEVKNQSTNTSAGPNWSMIISQAHEKTNQTKEQTQEQTKDHLNEQSAQENEQEDQQKQTEVLDWKREWDTSDLGPIVNMGPYVQSLNKLKPDWLAELPEALEPEPDPILQKWLAESEYWDQKYHSFLIASQCGDSY